MRRLQRRQRGQAIIILAGALLVLLMIVALATDLAVAYYWNTQAERAAAAGALAGAEYLPGCLDAGSSGPPTCTATYNARYQAKQQAQRNSFKDGDPDGDREVTVTQDAQNQYMLHVTAERNVPTYFFNVFGWSNIHVKREESAIYLAPITLGQGGTQIGSTEAEMGYPPTAGNCTGVVGCGYFEMAMNSWNVYNFNHLDLNNVYRETGDPYTANPAVEYDAGHGPASLPSTDIHALNCKRAPQTEASSMCSGSTQSPDRGGYNYQVTVPTGQMANIQVYNAADVFDSDKYVYLDTFHCDNVGTAYTAATVENPSECANPASYIHAIPYGDYLGNGAFNEGDFNRGRIMQYSVFKVNNPADHTQDRLLTQVRVNPVSVGTPITTGKPTCGDRTYDASIAGATSVLDVFAFLHGSNPYNCIQQQYNGDPEKSASNLKIFHSWFDIMNGDETYTATNGNSGNLVDYTTGFGAYGGKVGPGTYRVRVDQLDINGNDPAHSGQPTAGLKGYAVRCTGCSDISALDEMALQAPIQMLSSNSASIPIFTMGSEYQGQTVDLNLYDPGDLFGLTGSGSDPHVNMQIVRPDAATPLVPKATVYDEGISRDSGNNVPALQTGCPVSGSACVLTDSLYHKIHDGGCPWSGNGGYPYAASGPWQPYNGCWVKMQMTVPSNYKQPTTGNKFWMLNYRVPSGIHDESVDIITITVRNTGNPIHLVQ